MLSARIKNKADGSGDSQQALVRLHESTGSAGRSCFSISRRKRSDMFNVFVGFFGIMILLTSSRQRGQAVSHGL
jgi:hypothetical protein